MNIWNKVLLGVLIVLSLGCFYLAIGTLRIHRKWRSQANILETQIDQQTQQNQLLLEGGPARQGIRQGRAELYKWLVARGRAWKIGGADLAQPLGAEEAPAEVFWQVQPNLEANAAVIAFDAPEGFEPEQNQVLFLFEQPRMPRSTTQPGAVPQGAAAAEPNASDQPPDSVAQYLGEFKLPEPDQRPTDLQDGQVSLESALSMNESQLQRLGESRGPWVLYEVMPIDSHEALADLSDDELRARLPATTIDQYIKDGKPAGPEDQERADEQGNYVRALRDYASLFHELDRRRTTLVDLVAATRKDFEFVNASIAGALEQIEFRQGEISDLGRKLDDLSKQREAVVALRDRLAARLTQIQAVIEQTLEANKQLAAELAEIEEVAIRHADSRLRSSSVAE